MLRSHNWKAESESEIETEEMGKRKSSRANKAVKKKVEKLETVFSCPFCNVGQNVECSIYQTEEFDFSDPPEIVHKWVGTAVCYVCKVDYLTYDITPLTEPIDIYSEWIDECERVNNQEFQPVNKRLRCDLYEC